MGYLSTGVLTLSPVLLVLEQIFIDEFLQVISTCDVQRQTIMTDYSKTPVSGESCIQNESACKGVWRE